MNPAEIATSPLAGQAAEITIWTMFWGAHIVVKAVMIGLLAASSGAGRSSSTKRCSFAARAARWTDSTKISGPAIHSTNSTTKSRSARRREPPRCSSPRCANGSARCKTRVLFHGASDAPRTSARRVDRAGDRKTRIQSAGAGDGRLGQPVHRTVRHGLGHHDGLSFDRRLEEHSLAVVAPGIAEALFATAIGLFAAIPALIAYNKLQSDVVKSQGRMETFADEFSSILSRQIDQTAGGRDRAA